MKICQTIAVSTLKALRAERDEMRPGGPVAMIELRLDHLRPEEINVAAALDGRRLPTIVTCRPVREGGKFDGPEELRLQILREAAARGAEFVDVEFDADLSLTNTRTVLSHHCFTPGLPSDLAERIRAMRTRAAALPSAIVKIAVTAERPLDCVALRRALYGDGEAAAGTIGIAMGKAGELSRMLPAKFSGEWMYAGSAAPGQFTLRDMVERFRAHETSAATRVFGIAGKPLSHSASPAMHNAAFKHAGIDAVFVPFETADANELRDIANALNGDGFSVTAPLKSDVMSFAAPDDDGRAIGAINTLKRTNGSWSGTNFDAPAFSEPLRELHRDLRGLRAIVLGAGGAARAAVRELKALGCEVEISARDVVKAQTLADAFGATVTPFPPSGDAGVIVNATPVGTRSNGERSPISAGAVKAEIAYDLVYNPEETVFLSDARKGGAETIGGLAMLVAQARRQFAWWTGVSVPAAIFEEAAREFIR